MILKHKCVFREQKLLRNRSSRKKEKLSSQNWIKRNETGIIQAIEGEGGGVCVGGLSAQRSVHEQCELPLLVLYQVSRGADPLQHCMRPSHQARGPKYNTTSGFTFHQLLLNNRTSWGVSSVFRKMHIFSVCFFLNRKPMRCQ